ncbi:5691_t:CDS:2, partial [Acaulospora morrowiae]
DFKYDTSKKNSHSIPKKSSESPSFRVASTVEPEYAHTKVASIYHVMFSGGVGGSTADFLMHSIDTVKTRLQGQRQTKPPKYQNMWNAYTTIWKQEGLIRGLYGGVTPAILGSVPATTIYFGTYEFIKRKIKSIGITDTVAHLTAGKECENIRVTSGKSRDITF